jgi:hypothetical protein
VLLLADIPTVFDELETDSIFSRHLVDRLRALDGRGDWSALTAIKIAALLEPFRIRPKPIWPPRRTPSSKGARGYLRSSFETVWAIYCCAEDVTPSQPSAAKWLRTG